MDQFSPVDITLTSNKTLKERSLIESKPVFKDFDRGGGNGSGSGVYCVIA